MKYGDIDAIRYSQNADLLIRQSGLNREAIAEIVTDPNSVVARSKDTGVLVSEGTAGDQRVRVVVSETPVSGGSETEPLVISTMVLGDAILG